MSYDRYHRQNFQNQIKLMKKKYGIDIKVIKSVEEMNNIIDEYQNERIAYKENEIKALETELEKAKEEVKKKIQYQIDIKRITIEGIERERDGDKRDFESNKAKLMEAMGNSQDGTNGYKIKF